MSAPKFAFAADRKRFKEMVEEYIGGAFGEFAKAEVAEANAYLEYVPHWRREVSDLLDERLFNFVRRKKLTSGFDRAVAIQEVIDESNALTEYQAEVEAAKATLARKYFKNSKRLSDFKDPDIEAGWISFWIQVTSAVNDALEQRGEPLLPTENR